MVLFNSKSQFTIVVNGDHGDYLQTMLAIIGTLKGQGPDFYNRDNVYYLLSLLEEMMPDEQQAKELVKV